MTLRLAPLLAALALPAAAEETLAVLAVADPPGPEPELAETTHQLRAACRERTAGIQEVPEMRQRLLGQASGATLAELERAYGGALATYQNGEYPSSVRTLYAIVDDLEKLPEGPEAYAQWVRAQLRLAHAEGTVGRVREEREAMERVAAVEPRHQPDPDQYSPTYRREFDAARARVAARPRRKLTVDALGWGATIFVNGRAMGSAPLTVPLPPGRYRVGGSSGVLRVPSVWVELRDEDRLVTLDFGLADALRVNAGPGLALKAEGRAAGVVRAGAWLGVDRVLATTIAGENGVQFLVGSLYDVRRGALQREGRVRMAAGGVPGANLAALAAFLLTGQQSRLVVVAQAAPARPGPPLPAEPPPPPALALASPAATASAPPPVPAPAAPEPRPAPPTAPAAAVTARAGAAPLPPSPVEPLPAPNPPTTPPASPAAAPPRAAPVEPPAPPLRLEPPGAGGEASAADAAGRELAARVREPAPSPRPWLRPALWATGAAAVGLAGAATWQALAARGHERDAAAMLRPDGSLQPGASAAGYREARDAASAARRNAWAAAGGTALFAAAAGVLGWLSFDPAGAPVVRF